MLRDISQSEITANLSQGCLLKIITHYIQLRDAKAGQETNQVFLALFTEGHCSGLSILRAFGLLLSAIRPDRNRENCDDAEWFECTQRQLINWNGQDPDEIASIIEPFISKIVFFQKNYSVLALLQHNGANLHESAVSIDKNYYSLEFIRETEAGTKVQSLDKDEALVVPVFSTHFPALLEAAIPEVRMVLLSSKRHLMCVLRGNNDAITYYDPRFPEGKLCLNNFEGLAQAIERSIREINDPPVLCVDIYSFSEQQPLSFSRAQAVHDVMEKNNLFHDLTFLCFVDMLMANLNNEQFSSAIKLYLHSLSNKFSDYRALFFKEIKSIYGFFQHPEASEDKISKPENEVDLFIAEYNAGHQIELTNSDDWVIDAADQEQEDDIEANDRPRSAFYRG